MPAVRPTAHLVAEVLPPRKLDLKRNWALVKALVMDPRASVQWIFTGRPIIRQLLLYARRKREPAHTIERAAQVMHQPSDSQSHMDHVHVRIFCAPSDRNQGCIDRGPNRLAAESIRVVDTTAPDLPTLSRALSSRLSLRPVLLLGM